MKRLTERDEYGNADIVGSDMAGWLLDLDFEDLNLVTNALNKLADYEETGLTPEEINRASSIIEIKNAGKIVKPTKR